MDHVGSSADSLSVVTQGQISTLLPINATFSNTGTSGTNFMSTVTGTAAPTGSSLQVLFARKVELDYSSTNNVAVGGYSGALQVVVTTSGTGTHDKLVNLMNQSSLVGGNITSSVQYEAVVSNVGASTLISGHAGFLFANVRGVANINNITTLAAFDNQDTVAMVISAGPYVTQNLVELPPPFHPGLVVGRYYTAPYDTIAANTVSPNVIYLVPIHVPLRSTVTKVGFQVTTAAAGTARLGIYRALNGQPQALMIDAGAVSVSTTGAKEIAISQQLDSGMYYLAINFSIACSVNWHSGVPAHRASIYGQSSPTLTGSSQEYAAYISAAYGAMPSTGVGATVLYSATTQAEPHVWFRL